VTRLTVLFALLAAAAVSLVLASGSAASNASRTCKIGIPLCTDVGEPINDIAGGPYVGHDEPSLLFYDHRHGSGNDVTYNIRLPHDPPTMPTQDSANGVYWAFEQRAAYWFGMIMCDTQSAPEYQHNTCQPDSDSNIFDSTNPSSARYIGKAPGNAYMELQFYPPGWVPQFTGFDCPGTKWCVALTIDSLNIDQNNGINNNAACANLVGLEPVNWAYLTFSGTPHGAPDPISLLTGGSAGNPDPTTDLQMNGGDRLRLHMFDTAQGFKVVLNDLTSGQTGSMTASAANGFEQVLFQPNSQTCNEAPYTFHPEFSTSTKATRSSWAAHTYNVAGSDEIGHFEYCDRANVHGTCVNPGLNDQKKDADDVGCFNADASLRIRIGGCIATDNDFDGVSYQNTWPGSLTDPRVDAARNPQSIRFSSPTFNGGLNYSRVGFEADLPRIEAADFGGICDRSTGVGCVNPPPGSNFYPFFSTRNNSSVGCFWQLGGAHIPGTTNTFGGSSAAEFGPLLFLDYPGPGFTPIHRTNDFRQVLSNNPCLRS